MIAAPRIEGEPNYLFMEVVAFTGWDWWCWNVWRRLGFGGWARRYILGRLARAHGFPREPGAEWRETNAPMAAKLPDGWTYLMRDGSGSYEVV